MHPRKTPPPAASARTCNGTRGAASLPFIRVYSRAFAVVFSASLSSCPFFHSSPSSCTVLPVHSFHKFSLYLPSRAAPFSFLTISLSYLPVTQLRKFAEIR